MDRKHFVLTDPDVRKLAITHIMMARDGYHCIIQEPTRNLDQNAAQWPILEAFSDQLKWPVNGVMKNLDPEEWKAILTAAFRQEVPSIAPGLTGGIVMFGCRTREFSKREFSEWLDFLNATAAERGVNLEQR